MSDLFCYECNKKITIDNAFFGDDGQEAYCEKCFTTLNIIAGNIKLKCIKACNHFTVGKHYEIIEYDYDQHYIVLDDDNEKHYLSIKFAINHFMED